MVLHIKVNEELQELINIICVSVHNGYYQYMQNTKN